MEKKEINSQVPYMAFLMNSLPVSDIDTYATELLEEFCLHANMLRKSIPWCKKLPEDVFLHYVLFPRVNNEDLSSHRKLFYDLLRERVEGLSVEEAVLQVNQWCHENATYQQQDDRTASPLTVFRSGSGRCGEESAFLVAALRSVGIPARQVYSPWWAHCDDNHAWVEVWCEGTWNFLGACEPEPVLNRGWFNTAASRSVLVYSRLFGLPNGDENIHGKALGTDGIVTFYNQTTRYAITKPYEITVLLDGKVVEGAVVSISVLNYADYKVVQKLVTDKTGKVVIELGIGDLHISAKYNGFYAQTICKGNYTNACVLELSDDFFAEVGNKEFEFEAPKSSEKTAISLNAKQKKAREQVAKNGNEIREKRMESFFSESEASRFPDERDLLLAARGNFAVILGFLEKDGNPLRAAILRTLALKDLRDVTDEILEDHLCGAEAYVGMFPNDVYYQYLLCPRVHDELLSAWRSSLSTIFTVEQKEKFLCKPNVLWEYLQENITLEEQLTGPNLFWPPVQAYNAGRCDKKNLYILFVAILRALGKPAKLGDETGIPEYWQKDVFVPLQIETTVNVTFITNSEKPLLYGQNWSISRFVNGEWQAITLSDENWQGNKAAVLLPMGTYRLLTTNRLPNGNQFAIESDFSVNESEENLQIPVILRDFSLRDMIAYQKLPSFTACDEEGNVVENPGVLAGKSALLLFLEEGAEPTEHILNELIETSDHRDEFPAEIYFFLRNKEALTQRTIASLLSIWPGVHIFFEEWEYNVELLARELCVDPDNPPLAFVCDGHGNALYATSGYNVGSVELMAQIVRYLQEG